MSAKPLTKKEWEASVAETFSACVQSTYQDLIDEAVLAERAACLEDVKKVFDTFDSLPQSPEVNLVRSLTSTFFEAIAEAVNVRGQA